MQIRALTSLEAGDAHRSAAVKRGTGLTASSSSCSLLLQLLPCFLRSCVLHCSFIPSPGLIYAWHAPFLRCPVNVPLTPSTHVSRFIPTQKNSALVVVCFGQSSLTGQQTTDNGRRFRSSLTKSRDATTPK